MDIQNFWSEVGSTKNFTDPFFLDKLASHLNKNSQIIEYGCGYGRILDILHKSGYQSLMGFDFAAQMIQRGKTLFPHLELQLINETGKIPLKSQSVDSAILSTVLCCNPAKKDQESIINELHRVLKPNGILYLCDFLVTDSEKFLSRYKEHAIVGHEDFGIYKTSEGVFVRHHSMQWILKLLKQFTIIWLEEMNDVTMNGNPVRTFHLTSRKNASRN